MYSYVPTYLLCCDMNKNQTGRTPAWISIDIVWVSIPTHVGCFCLWLQWNVWDPSSKTHAVCCGRGLQWSIFSHYPSAYVWFIYIHGYPDNEAFNPGDPVVRTMNPITSCRLWDGMADSETDGRGCTRPAIQSHSSRLFPVPCSCVLQQLINRRRPNSTASLHHTPMIAQTHAPRSARSLGSTRPPLSTLAFHHLCFTNTTGWCEELTYFIAKGERCAWYTGLQSWSTYRVPVSRNAPIN